MSEIEMTDEQVYEALRDSASALYLDPEDQRSALLYLLGWSRGKSQSAAAVREALRCAVEARLRQRELRREARS